jgi:hypothetical protein
MRLMALLLLLAGMTLALPTPAAQAQEGSANPFGVVEGMWLPDETCDLGVGWERIIFDWAQHQPDGPDDWNTLNVDDRWLKAASECDREVVALLKHTPAWATDGTPGIGVPRGLALPWDDPANTWGQFVYRTASYYASRGVQRFIIWNEPDIQPGTYGYEFEGSLEDYYLLLRVASQAARHANPAAKIHLAGTTYWHDVNEGRVPYTQRLIERILQDPEAAADGYYFDVVSLHIYFRSSTVYDLIRLNREWLDQHGLADKAIWVNETNAAPTDDPGWPVVRPVYPLDLAAQADFLWQAAALAMRAGAERVAAYKLLDQGLPEGGESFGLLRPGSYEKRPAFHAWRAIGAALRDVQPRAHYFGEAATVLVFEARDGAQLTLAWATGRAPVAITLVNADDKAYTIDRLGHTMIIRPDQGTLAAALAPARCTSGDGCFIGGPVWAVVQPRGSSAITINGEEITLIEQE